jgi:asparagine synthase (glutamine-hydrolysing)
MSGVFGLVDSRRRSPSGQLRRMATALQLLEWTSAQAWEDEPAGVGLGQVNVGLFSADCPLVHSEDGKLTVAFFGELYYTERLQHRLSAAGSSPYAGGNAGLILRLYRERGKDLIRDLEGVFVLALWDRELGRLLVANDRFGLIPTYYAHYDGRLLFAPLVKAILAHPSFEKQLDLTAMAQLLRFQRLLGDRTFFERVKLLPYGSVLEFNRNHDLLDVSHYWDFGQIPPWSAGITFDDAVSETCRLLRRAVEARLQGQYRLGVYLSGGLDSRTLLGMAARVRSPLVSLTYGVPDCRDAYYAEKIARRAGSLHHFFPLTHGRWVRDAADLYLDITEGFVTWTHSHAAPTLRPGRELMDVNLTGFFGDQVLGARALEHSPAVIGATDELEFAARMYDQFVHHYSWPNITDGEERLLFSESFYPLVRDRAFNSLVETLNTMNGHEPAHKIDYLTTVYQGIRLTNMTLVYQRAFFEARYPFCDYDLVDWVYAMPPHYRLHDRLYMEVINREIPELTWIPRDTDERLLTRHQTIREAHALWQKVQRRITGRRLRTIHEDPEGWLRRDLREWAEDLLLSSRTLERGFYNPAFLHSLFERHMSGREVHTIGKIAPIMTYEMMLRRFYDGDSRDD